jgi:mono/diheme cytochrome c family protein
MTRIIGVIALALALLGAGYWYITSSPAGAADTSDAPPPGEKSQITNKPPLDVVAQAPKGSLHNPYDGNAQAAEEGHKLFLSYSCNGCHGGNGGGGMCPPLTNGVWIYGGDDDTLFRLIALGSDKLQAAGYQREAIENVVGPMPSMGPLIKNDDQLWKIIAFVRSAYTGPPGHKYK